MCSEATQNIQQSHDFYFPCSCGNSEKKKTGEQRKQNKKAMQGGSKWWYWMCGLFISLILGRKSLYHSAATGKETDQTLLEDILVSVEEWRKKCATLLVNRNLEEYHIQKNQVPNRSRHC
jgi:hypothetical protein